MVQRGPIYLLTVNQLNYVYRVHHVNLVHKVNIHDEVHNWVHLKSHEVHECLISHYTRFILDQNGALTRSIKVHMIPKWSTDEVHKGPYDTKMEH